MLGEIGAGGSSRIDYLVLGLFASTSVVGVYYFAFQLVAKGASVIGLVARTVMYPNLARRIGSSESVGGDLQVIGIALVSVSSVGAALLIPLFGLVETLAWGGRWADAVAIVLLLATVLPVQVAASGPEQLLKASGRFRAWTLVLTSRSVWLGSMLALFGTITRSPTAFQFAMAFGLAAALSAVVEIVLLGRWLSFDVQAYLRNAASIAVPVVGSGWLAWGLIGIFELQPVSAIAVSCLAVTVALSLGWVTVAKRPSLIG